jgi:hypothetical protein
VIRNWFPVAINIFAVILAIGVSSAIGIFFGVFPAKKAADLSPWKLSDTSSYVDRPRQSNVFQVRTLLVIPGTSRISGRCRALSD